MLLCCLCKSRESVLNKQHIWLFFFIAVNTVSVNGIWPMPQKISSSIERYCVKPQSFEFQYTNLSVVKPGCSVLDAAFKRYFKLIFPDLLKDPGRLHANRTEHWSQWKFSTSQAISGSIICKLTPLKAILIYIYIYASHNTLEVRANTDRNVHVFLTYSGLWR